MSAQNSYETMLIFSLTKGDEGTAELVEKFKALIEANGTLDSVEEWGKRRLAYPPMRKQTGCTTRSKK